MAWWAFGAGGGALAVGRWRALTVEPAALGACGSWSLRLLEPAALGACGSWSLRLLVADATYLRAASMALASSSLLGSVLEPQRPTTLPSLPTRNFSKFQRISLPPPASLDTSAV